MQNVLSQLAQRLTLQSSLLIGAVLLLLVMVFAFAIDQPLIVFGLAFVALVLFFWWAFATRWSWMIGARIRRTVGSTTGMSVHTKWYPAYKFVDIHRAAQTLAARTANSEEVLSEHPVPLGMLIGDAQAASVLRIAPPTRMPRKVSYDDEAFIPADAFWLIPRQPGGERGPSVIRVRLPQRGSYVSLEIAARDTADAEQIMHELGEIASANSIYRNKMIRVVFNQEVRTMYDEDESLDAMDLLFYRDEPIADADIVMDDALHSIIERTVIDFHQRRDELMALGLPGKRGVLFYGPPGTGKTYTCKYIAQQLTDVTTIVATGHALLNMKAICAIATMLQPSLVLLEDVDLVFSQRDINPYATVLGEFIDQLDGFGEHDKVIFILTTNAIERIEAAIKDRPGRVSQCIFFGPPAAPLRRRYLEALLTPYDVLADLEHVVSRTEGVTQAFLKELAFRVVQIATANNHATGRIALADTHFETALDEMIGGSGRAAQRIIGFRVDAER